MFAPQSMICSSMQNFKKLMALILLALTGNFAFAQPNTNVDLDKEKPKQYERRELPSEKTGEKKFTLPRRFTNNLYTHYNYYFNANNKLNEVIENSKAAFKDDFTQLLPFYNYTLDGTAQNKGDLDSIIYKCTAGILLHDLRSDWVDNMYMLMGRAYLLRKDYDSAASCFQYINYTYAPKEEGGYDILLGSSTSNTAGKFTISTNEKRSLLKKITSRPPSRNESFVWQARNYLEQDQMGEAAGLLGILRNDPYFPKRLQTDLHEMVAYMFYKQQNYDSAAYHLKKSLDNAESKNEQARWEFLTGQLYQAANKDSIAIKMYERSIKHTVDPLMEIYARLNIVSLASSSKKDALQDNLDELIKLAKRDKYEEFRDIIYYAAALLELKRNSYDAAEANLLKSVKYSVDNPKQKSMSFLLLADMNYGRNHFIAAHNYYDSVQADVIKSIAFSKDDKDRFELRKPTLKIIATNIETVIREDSLQRVALMPEAERSLFIRKILRKLRKERGLKETDEPGSYNTQSSSTSKDANLFGEEKGDFYFGNSNVKSKGFSEFKVRWGKRPNVDNWRRQSAVDKISNTPKGSPSSPDVDDVGGKPVVVKGTGTDEEKGNDDISFEGLMSKLPLTAERIAASNKKIMEALFQNGETFQNRLENYPAAIETYDELLRRFGMTMFTQKEETLFNLYYCSNKMGLFSKADSAKAAMTAVFSDGNFTNKLREGNSTETKKKDAAVTKKYESIYGLFVEGKFEQAKQEKARADAQYGNNYWTPQLLYIESIYYIRQRNDDTAISKLQSLKTLFPKSPLAPKAQTMIDVLRKRTEIETYLTNLKVERKQDSLVVIDTTSTYVPPVAVKPAVKKDKFDFVATDSQYVMVILDKVDRVFVNETKNSFNQYNAKRFRNLPIASQTFALNDQYSILLMGPFVDAPKALDYLDKTRPEVPTVILSWLAADKYSFSLISSGNLTLLKETKDIGKYQQMLKQAVPGKF
jgi:hypothetical protein